MWGRVCVGSTTEQQLSHHTCPCAPPFIPLSHPQGSKSGKRFEIKKWNAVAMWSWAICTDTCAICRNNLYEPSIEYQANPTGERRGVQGKRGGAAAGRQARGEAAAKICTGQHHTQ